MAEMEVSPQEEMANAHEMKMFAVERHGLPDFFFLLCVECNRRHSYLCRIGRLSGRVSVLQVYVLLS